MNPSFSSLVTVSSHITDNINVTLSSSLRHLGQTSLSSSEGKAEHGCLVQEHIPQDNPENVISKQAHFWMTTIISSGVIPLLFLVGVPGNILSAAVFYKQGLKERINFCIVSLALVDLFVISTDFVVKVEEAYRKFVGSSNFFIKYFVGLTGFTWVSMFLSAVIAVERCFCVVSPLRAQRMLSTRTMAAIVIPISFILLTGMLVIAGPKHTEACVFDSQTSRISYIVYVTEYYIENKEILDIVDIFVYATALPVMFFVVIVVTTVITAVKLHSASRWRQQSSSASGAQPAGNLEIHVVALTRMLIVASVLFVVCIIPVMIVQMAIFGVSELKYGGRYHNLIDILWNIVPMFRCINSSLNFFVYYKMGSRFRYTLKQLLPCTRGKMNTSGSDHVASSNISWHSKQRDFALSGNDKAAE